MKEIKNVVTWLKNWFYDKTEVYTKTETYSKEDVNTALGNKVNVAQGSGNSDKNVVTNSSGNITTEPKVSAGSGLSLSNTNQMSHSNSVTAQTSAVFKKITYDGQGHITGTANVNDSDLPSHNHPISNVTHLQTELDGIDTRLDNLESIKAIEVVASLPTASASTMGKLYIISENSKINVYYTTQSSSTYNWHKMDADILDELSISWNDITGKPTKTSDFTNDGADGTNVFVSNNDSRLSDARTPTSHTHGLISNDGKLTTSATVASGDSIVITDLSDNSKIKRVENLLASHIEDSTAHTNIGSGTYATQSLINSKIDTQLGNKLSATKVTSWSSTTSDSNVPSEKLVKDSLDLKADASDVITSISLIPKGSDPTADAYNGVIRFYQSDEP